VYLWELKEIMQSENLTAATRKLIASLKQSRHRRETGLFVIEGTRSVLDSASLFEVEYLIATSAWVDEFGSQLPKGLPQVQIARRDDIERMSSLSTPQGVMAVCKIPAAKPVPTRLANDELILALDRVQDPGNLGTIIRVADWMGVTTILASTDTVDLYSPKVVQSTMGSLARVNVIYVNLPEVLAQLGKNAAVYGTFLDGDNIYSGELTQGGIVVMGNEGNGISREVEATVTQRIRIPSYPEHRDTVESLNVSIATAITLAEFRRRAK
jgi:TrmH family RNA methyltransferase